jgi:hypothetical protein
MYNFKKLKGEKIKYISDNAILKKDKDYINISVILTDKRLILLDYPSAVNNFEEVLRTSRNVEYMREKEPILIVNLSDIDHIDSEEFDKYVLKDGNFFYLQDDDLRKDLY